MRYLVVICFFIFSFCVTIFAQKGSLYVSINNGINYSDIKTVNEPYIAAAKSIKSPIYAKKSYRYGIGVKYQLSKSFSIGTACNIEEKGWFFQDGLLLDTTRLTTLNGVKNYYYPYISFPLIIDYSLQIKKVKLLIEGGYLINVRRQGGTIKTNIKGTIGTIASLIQPYDAPLLDYGWMYGGGIEMNLQPNISISLLGRYAQSYTGIADWGVGQAYYRHHNYAALLQLSYKIK
jgi:hypothetical protein